MKKSILIIPMLALSSLVFAQTDTSNIKQNLHYCAELRDGILIVVADQQEITSDVVTENGTIIKSNGSVMKKDGVTTVLREGECVDTEGIVVKITENKQRRKESDIKMSKK
ncbi:MAG: DUF6799 domain-containing protein [Bacteroidota bacterium]